MTTIMVIAAALAGGIGAAVRFILDGLVRNRITTAIPAGTVFINVSGSLLLGLLAGLVLGHSAPFDLQVILGTGFLGGYTTFSTANVETVRLIQSGRTGRGIINALGTMVLSVVAAGGGLVLGVLI